MGIKWYTLVKRWKTRNRFTNKDLAERWGVHPIYISRLLNGHSNPSPQLAWKISKDTGIPLERILGLDGDRDTSHTMTKPEIRPEA